VVTTDHSAVDYALVARAARLLLDTRNVFSAAGAPTVSGALVKI
jgi:UDP-N-acetyl-D-glucosamine dehydrogenase